MTKINFTKLSNPNFSLFDDAHLKELEDIIKKQDIKRDKWVKHHNDILDKMNRDTARQHRANVKADAEYWKSQKLREKRYKLKKRRFTIASVALATVAGLATHVITKRRSKRKKSKKVTNKRKNRR